jgi:hypothetical protein
MHWSSVQENEIVKYDLTSTGMHAYSQLVYLIVAYIDLESIPGTRTYENHCNHLWHSIHFHHPAR